MSMASNVSIFHLKMKLLGYKASDRHCLSSSWIVGAGPNSPSLGSSWPISRLGLLGKSTLILGMAIAFLEHELTDPGVRIEGQGCMSEVHDLQDLMV